MVAPKKVVRRRSFELTVLWVLLALSCWALGCPKEALSLNLETALALARVRVPLLRAAQLRVRSSEQLRKASLSPYLPRLDVSANMDHLDSDLERYSDRGYSTDLSLTLFDGGKRSADRMAATLNLQTDREEFRKAVLELELNVKLAFYETLASQQILNHRTVQLKDARTDLEVATGRYEVGIVKRSDVLQASVRYEQAKFSKIKAEGRLKKSLAQLNSLVGRNLNSPFDLEGDLGLPVGAFDFETLFQLALSRPVVKQAEDEVLLSESKRKVITSTFLPTISANASYSQSDIGGSSVFSLDSEDKRIGVTATWNLFELGKFFRKRSSDYEIMASHERLLEVKRQLRVDVHNRLEDLNTALRNVPVARRQLMEAQFNYKQALGEYRLGKGDILSLVQAEKNLAFAREQLTTSQLNVMIAKSQLERTIGVADLTPYCLAKRNIP